VSTGPARGGRIKLAPTQWLTTMIVVTIAKVLSRMSPKHLSAVLRIARRGARQASYEQAQLARTTVVRVSRRCAGDGCLPRSIATALLCRLGGTWATWNVGVLTSPLTAHAWVEAEGRLVDEPQGIETFRPLITVAPLSTTSRGQIPDTGTPR
jgi:hypothetical protein